MSLVSGTHRTWETSGGRTRQGPERGRRGKGHRKFETSRGHRRPEGDTRVWRLRLRNEGVDVKSPNEGRTDRRGLVEVGPGRSVEKTTDNPMV